MLTDEEREEEHQMLLADVAFTPVYDKVIEFSHLFIYNLVIYLVIESFDQIVLTIRPSRCLCICQGPTLPPPR